MLLLVCEQFHLYIIIIVFFYDHASHADALHVCETLWRLAYMNLCLAT